MKEQIKTQLIRKGFSLDDDQLRSLEIYLKFLLKWNRVMNLVGRSDWKFILNNLVLDSFFLGGFLSKIHETGDYDVILDLGAGAGLPGIPLRLVWKKGRYYLVESRAKRAVFMNQAIAAMDLGDTFVVNRRIEEMDQKLLPAGMIISRAFMPWPELLPLTRKMLDNKGMLIILSSEKYQGQELSGFRMVDVMKYKVEEKYRYFWALESNI